MKVRVLATGNAPTHYSFDGDVVTAHHNNQTEQFDLSALGSDDKFTGVSVDILSLSAGHVIRDAYRDESGELHVTLCQQVGPGHWSESDWMDATAYDPVKVNAVYDNTKTHSGTPWVVTQEGKQWVK